MFEIYKNATLSYGVGALFLALSKIKYNIGDYTPREEGGRGDASEHAYTVSVIEEWRRILAADQPGFDLSGRAVLELGPGNTLGAGVLLLALGAARYAAYDVHDLAARPAVEHYAGLLDRYEAEVGALGAPRQAALDAVAGYAAEGGDARLRFVVTERFDFAEFEPGSFDLVVSQAAFEHFRDPERTIADLTPKCRSGATFLAVIDLATHGRWIKDHDPLNIYRFHRGLYDALSHPATPNRVRPGRYVAALERAGWIDIRLACQRAAPEGYAAAVRDHLRAEFRDDWLACRVLIVTARLP